MPKDYLHNGDYLVSRELLKINRLPEPNRTYALQYKDFLEANNRQSRTIYKRIYELRFILELLGNKDAKSLTKPDIESLVRRINKAKSRDSHGKETDKVMASTTRTKIKLTLKTFMRWLAGRSKEEPYPDIVKWIDVRKEVREKLPEELLTEDEVESLINACKNQRDKTIIALLWDTGMRVSELLNLKIKDVSLQKEGISHIRIYGKTGARQCPLTFSIPYLSNYFNDYRKNARADDSLFVVIRHNMPGKNPLDYTHVRKLLQDLRIRAKLSKRLYPHLFRHSRATDYANKLTEQQAKIYFGWTKDSGMMAKYVHLSGRDIDAAVLQANGLQSKEKEAAKPQVKKCEVCKAINEITAKYCTNCKRPLDIVEQINENKAMQERINKLENAIEKLYQHIDDKTRKEISG
jgi:integrase/recombinase XerD